MKVFDFEVSYRFADDFFLLYANGSVLARDEDEANRLLLDYGLGQSLRGEWNRRSGG